MNKHKQFECIYCHSSRVRLENGMYYCESCECIFTETDIEVEDIRHEIFHLLAKYSEDNPFICDIAIDAEYSVVSCFSCYDGTLWFTLRGETEPRDFDDFTLAELQEILKGLKETRFLNGNQSWAD